MISKGYARALSIVSLIVVSACLAVSGLLAVVAFEGSRETGAGAAQGGLGFFMMLLVITPIIAGALIVAVLLRILAQKSEGYFPIAFVLTLVLLAWDWGFLFLVWKN